MREKIIIIGGGIGGASAALALQKIGMQVEVFEREPELKEVGAGLALWVAPFRALERLGVGDRIRQLSTPLQFGEFGLPRAKYSAHGYRKSSRRGIQRKFYNSSRRSARGDFKRSGEKLPAHRP
jgi:2-polyprenyl-6-methoxyphenol hydroxylase-like FAD-dependent oxidoreductase